MCDTVGGEDDLVMGTEVVMRSTKASFNMAFGSGELENTDAGVNNVTIRSVALLRVPGRQPEPHGERQHVHRQRRRGR